MIKGSSAQPVQKVLEFRYNKDMAENLDTNLEAALELVARWINESQRMVVFTGAGVSTESGIPDFRSPGGIWSKYDPSEFTFDKFVSDPEVRKKRWRLFLEEEALWTAARPNPAHLAVAELHRLGKLRAVITQNIDGLHQEAGLPDELVIELHGTNRFVACLSCSARWPSAKVRERLRRERIEDPPCPECGGIIKTATISFGQRMPEKETRESERLSREADLMLVMGSTLVVHPAAIMPMIAKEAGGRVVIINLSETAGDRYAEMVIRGKAGEILPEVVKRFRKKLMT